MDISSGSPSHSANTTQTSPCVTKPLFVCAFQALELALTLHLAKQGSGGWWSLGCQRWRATVTQEMQYKDGWIEDNKCRGLREWTSGNSLRTTSIFWGLQLLWAQSITLGRGSVMALGWHQLLWSDQPSLAFQPCCCSMRSARLFWGMLAVC